jgi:hypothetical protein
VIALQRCAEEEAMSVDELAFALLLDDPPHDAEIREHADA